MHFIWLDYKNIYNLKKALIKNVNLIFSYILKRKNGMTIEECYVKMGANYQDVIKRLPSAKMIEKFALKFKDDTSFQELETALNEKQVELAFRAAHTLKGVCMNLGFDHLYKPSFEITESLRAGNLELGLQQFGAVKEQYTKTIDALNEFALENE